LLKGLNLGRQGDFRDAGNPTRAKVDEDASRFSDDAKTWLHQSIVDSEGVVVGLEWSMTFSRTVCAITGRHHGWGVGSRLEDLTRDTPEPMLRSVSRYWRLSVRGSLRSWLSPF